MRCGGCVGLPTIGVAHTAGFSSRTAFHVTGLRKHPRHTMPVQTTAARCKTAVTRMPVSLGEMNGADLSMSV